MYLNYAGFYETIDRTAVFGHDKERTIQMSLQDIFYLTNIIFMSMMILILVVIVILLFYIKAKIGELSAKISEQIDAVGRITANAETVASSVSAVATGAMKKVSNIMGSSKSNKG